MAAYGSSISAGAFSSPDKIAEMIDEVFEGISGLKGLHCCGNTDWSVLLKTRLDILNFDAYNYAESVSLYPAEIKKFMDRGGAIAWGIVPNDGESINKESVASLKDRLEEAMAPFTRNGVRFKDLIAQSLITPSCTLVPLGEEGAEKALELAERLLDPEELARLLYFAGIRYFRQGENRLAEDHWLRSLEICQQIGDLPTQAKLYQNLGWQSKMMGDYDKLGDWGEAIENLQKSLNLTEQAGLRKATSRVFSALGDIYRHQGKLSAADECYQRSLASITAAGSSQSLFVVNLGLGLINMERKRYDQAKQFLEKCWAITSEGVGFTSRMATVKTYMGELLVRTDELEEATEACAVALDLAQKANARPELAQAMMVQGMVATRQQDWATALERYSHARQIFEEIRDKYNLGRVYFELGMMYRDRGDGEEDKNQSKAFLKKAREIFSALGAEANLAKFPSE